MNKNYSVIFWSSRILVMIILLLLLLLSFDVFELEGSLLELIGAFLIHNIPFIILLIGFIFSWKRDLLGCIIFFISATSLTVFLGVRGGIDVIGGALIIIIPGYIASILYFINWFMKTKNKNNNQN